MNTIDLVALSGTFNEQFGMPTPVFQDDQHAVYWLGTPEKSAFRCNTYMILDGQEAVIVDPGGHDAFDFIVSRVSQVVSPEKVTALILSHQDPDVAASMTGWLDMEPKIHIVTSVRTNILLPHYGKADYKFFNINENPEWTFQSGRKLQFIESPFLHFPGAFVTYDEMSEFLFSGDIWASIGLDWKLVIDDFSGHEIKLNLFHLDYMAGNVAARGFVDRISSLELNALLPQHGSFIPMKCIPDAMEYLRELRCGLDLIYPGGNNEFPDTD